MLEFFEGVLSFVCPLEAGILLEKLEEWERAFPESGYEMSHGCHGPS